MADARRRVEDKILLLGRPSLIEAQSGAGAHVLQDASRPRRPLKNHQVLECVRASAAFHPRRIEPLPCWRKRCWRTALQNASRSRRRPRDRQVLECARADVAFPRAKPSLLLSRQRDGGDSGGTAL